ncbi:hypothetical protein AC579_9179 [Pseudocercospora musae]|uniref:Uncharacterized protein n=1 Tax=Pseudocercospora musae TaxID=113226 RepID=A0A139I7A3_9PEZI|nr:hypothetical protein AC579_9179 [Pseudocercospora musae]
MPVIPLALSTLPDDTRILDSRQIRNAASHIVRAVSQLSHHLRRSLTRRQNGAVVAIPTQYEGIRAGPAPGAVAGIVLGSVAGFLLLLWLLWIASSGSGFIRATNLTEEDVVVRRRDRSRSTRRSRARTEMASRSPRRERVIRQERIVRDNIPPPREPSRIRETIVVEEERRVPGDDIVEVIEEHSSVGVPPPRRKSRRSSAGYSLNEDLHQQHNRRGEFSDY